MQFGFSAKKKAFILIRKQRKKKEKIKNERKKRERKR